MRAANAAWTGLRWLFALFFFSTGIFIVLHVTLGVGEAPRQGTAAAQALDDAFHASGIIDPLIAIDYLIGGAALAWRRTAPLGLVLLGPTVVGIAVFDVILARTPIGGVVTAAVWGLLVFRYFSGFTGLWTYRQPA